MKRIHSHIRLWVMFCLPVLVWVIFGLLNFGAPLQAQDGSTHPFVLYVPLTAASHNETGGQTGATCPYLPDALRYHYTPADPQTGGFHRHSFLVEYNILDLSYIGMAAEYEVASDVLLSDLVLSGVTHHDSLPIGLLRFGEYSQSPQLQNGVTYHWRVRLLCTDASGATSVAEWTPVQIMVAGETSQQD